MVEVPTLKVAPVTQGGFLGNDSSKFQRQSLVGNHCRLMDLWNKFCFFETERNHVVSLFSIGIPVLSFRV